MYGLCKELLPAPGNRSNKRRDREEDLATTEEKKVGTEEAGVEKSRVSDEWSRDLKSVQVQKQLSCRDESPDPSMSKIVLRNLIISSKYYKEEEAKELLEVITAERLETEQRQKLEQQEQLSIEKLRLEMELSRIANQSANQNNGQTSRVKSLDEIVKMVRLLTIKVPNKSDGWEYFFSSLEKAFASEMVSDELKPKVLLCMLGDKVSNLLVNLGEEELKDYESLKQVVLKEYEPSPKICLENFRKAKRNSDETFSQFASRLTSMWLYYCMLRGANDFESVSQLIVADKMFEMLDSETATHIGKSYDEPERAKWNDSEKRSFNGSWGKQPFGEKKSDNFSSRKNFDKGQVTEIKKFACFTCGSDKHFKRDCPKNKEVDNKRLNVNKVSTEGTELVDGTVAARVDVLGKVIPRRAIEDKLSKLVKTSISVDGKLVHALLDSGTEITVIKKDLVPGISVEGASTIYLKGIFGPAVKCPLVYVPIGLATGGQVKVVHQQVLCALAEVLVEDVLLPPEVLDMLGGAQSEENSLAQSSQDLRVDSGNVDETEVSSGILPEKAQEHIEDSQRNITSCRNEVGTLGTKDEEVTTEMDKGIMVADSFRSEQECCAELALVWKYAKEGKGNYYEVDGYLFRRDKILGESIGQLVIPKCRRTEVLKLAHTSVFSSHMGPKKTIERIKYSFFWEGLRAGVKKFCESCKECQLTRSVRIKDRPPITPVARPELPFQVVNMDLIGPIDPPSSKGHKYILCLVDQHTRWGEAVPLTSLSAKVACEAFVKLKELPCEVTSLATPDANLPFQVHCDASDYGVGCCLIQQDTEGIYRPIAFASQKFNATQKNWASIEKEAWAVSYGLNKFDKWIYGAKVEIISDHNPLKYLNQTTPKSPKLTRWALALQRWNHPITHRPGGACKELLPAPGNRSNKRRDREEDLATTEEKKVGTEEAGVEKSRANSSATTKTFFGFINKIYVLFSKSSKRWDIVKTKLKLTLKPLSETRWESRIGAVKAIFLQFDDVIECVNELKNKTDDSETLSDCDAVLNEMFSFEFIVALHVWYEVLLRVNNISKLWQSVQVDLKVAINTLLSFCSWIQEFRNAGLDNSVAQARLFVEKSTFEIESQFKEKRTTRKKRMFGYEHIDEPIKSFEMQYRVNFFNTID
ncbi:retrovirus-related Pol polyprotein from transposon opus [Trichonephila clavipes]|nr:retrovirus-related Pol polyprotein from transposon opus [Trichonephila clavipes]